MAKLLKRAHHEAAPKTIFSLPPHLLRTIALLIGTTKERGHHPETLANLLFAASVSPSVLIVGSGNFTFESSVSNLRSQTKGIYGAFNSRTGSTASHFCATSYDSLDDLHRKYGREEMDTTLSSLSDNEAEILFEIDATRVDEEMAAAASSSSSSRSTNLSTPRRYDLIVFNFPKVAVTSREEFQVAGRVPRNRYLIVRNFSLFYPILFTLLTDI
jgi:hypothetical protein